MPMKTDFRSILKEKMESVDSPSKDPTPSPPSSHRACPDEPQHLAFLMGTIEKTMILNKKSYIKNKMNLNTPFMNSNSSNASNNTIDLMTLPKPPQHLSYLQQQSWLWFWMKGSPLQDHFSQYELQKHFRKLAQAIHPDKNKHPKANETFMKLREHYRILSDL